MLYNVWSDLRHAARSLSRNPGFTLVAIATLAVGIGANTAIFSLVDAVLLRPLPVEGLARLHVVREDQPRYDMYGAPLSPPEVLDLAEREDVFDAVMGFQIVDRTLTGYGEPERIRVAATLGDFRGVLGVQPVVGRFYRPEQSTDGTHRVAVVSYGLWQRLAGADAAFIGRTLELDGESFEVLGVMPADLRYPRGVQVWVPLPLTARDLANRNRLVMTTVVRTRPEVSDSQLGEQLAAEVGRWNEQHYAPNIKALTSTPLAEDMAGPLRNVLLVLLAAVGFVLLLAAVNVASLQLVRSAGRAKELAVRAALGAASAHLVRPLLIESAFLAAFGGAVGLGLGWLMIDLIESWPLAQQMNLTGVSLDRTVLAATALAALLAAVASCVLPARRAALVDPHAELRRSGRGTSIDGNSRLMRAGSVLQIALAVVLLLGFGLMVRTLSHLLDADPGFEPRGVVTARISLPDAAYESTERRVAFFDALLERIRATPGIDTAALVSYLPFSDEMDSSPFSIVGETSVESDELLHAEAQTISSDYFRTMGIPLLEGRDFDAGDRFGSARVVIIDQTFAEQFFPGGRAIGRQIMGGHTFGERATVVGVVGRVDHDEMGDRTPKPVAYYPYAHHGHYGYAVAVLSAQPLATIVSTLRSALAELDPNVPLYDIETMDGRIERTFGPRRLAMLALAGFAALALVLAALGVYGVMRYTTDQRFREIGIRIAVGAQHDDVIRLVLGQGMVIAGVGLAAGLAVSLALTRLMHSVLFGVSPHDPATFAAAAVVVAAVALVATWLPARRAMRLDPMRALRTE